MFNEKTTEFYKGKELPVWQSPKYQQSKTKALEIIKKYDCIHEGDFWILMNTYANGQKMMYSGLIISHNGCLKINQEQPEELRFKPSCVTVDKEGYKGSLAYTYCNDKQGIYEVGEVSEKNCKNDYPYAMAFKRLFDRVVLKLCGLAYDGVYSDSEADEFKERIEDDAETIGQELISERDAKNISDLAKTAGKSENAMCEYFKISSIDQMNKAQYMEAYQMLTRHIESKKTNTKEIKV